MSREGFYRATARYYKTERNRSEKCLGLIIDTLDEGGSNGDQINRIIECIMDHYKRSDSALSQEQA